MKKHSILISVYNGDSYIGDTLDSLAEHMNYPFVELIVYDDGSNDSTQSIIRENVERFSDLNIDYHCYFGDTNNGKAFGFSKLLELCSGDSISFLGADDCVTCNYVNAIKIFQANTDPYTILASSMLIADENLNVTSTRKPTSACNSAFYANTLPGGSLIFSKSIAEIIHPLPPQLANEDYWIQLHASYYKFAVVKQYLPIIIYRTHPSSSRSRDGNLLPIKILRSYRLNQRCTTMKLFASKISSSQSTSLLINLYYHGMKSCLFLSRIHIVFRIPLILFILPFFTFLGLCRRTFFDAKVMIFDLFLI